MIKINKGLDLPIAGAPEQQIDAVPRLTRQVAILGQDYPGMKPTMLVAEGDAVQVGTPLFSDKKNDGVIFTAPAAGRVEAINRGAKRALLSVVIAVAEDGDEAGAADEKAPEAPVWDAFGAAELLTLERQKVVDQLVSSGLWTALRTRIRCSSRPWTAIRSPPTRR